MSSSIVCDECGQAHQGIPAQDCDAVISAYSLAERGHELHVPPLDRVFLPLFLEACRYFMRKSAPPAVAEIVHRHRPPVVRDLGAAACAADRGDSVLWEGQEYVWNGESWEALPCSTLH